MRSFEGRVAVITGAASGIGRSLCVSLAELGCDIAASDINEVGLAETAAEVERVGRHVSTHLIDVSDRKGMEAFPAEVDKEHGRVDIVVNNAGVSVAANLVDHSIEDFEWIVGINFWGVVYGCKFFLPQLVESGDGYIVNLSSMFGLVGVPGQASYCATKFAVRGFSEALAAELHGTGVRVLSVHPGGIATNIAKATRWPEGEPVADRQRIIDFFEKRAMSPDKAAARIVSAMKSGKNRVLIAPEAYLTDYIKRIFPVVPPGLLAKARDIIARR